MKRQLLVTFVLSALVVSCTPGGTPEPSGGEPLFLYMPVDENGYTGEVVAVNTEGRKVSRFMFPSIRVGQTFPLPNNYRALVWSRESELYIIEGRKQTTTEVVLPPQSEILDLMPVCRSGIRPGFGDCPRWIGLLSPRYVGETAYLLDAETGEITNLYRYLGSPEMVLLQAPSPGYFIALTFNGNSGGWWLIPAEQPENARLLDNGDGGLFLDVSADGQWVAYTRHYKGGPWQLVIEHTDGTNSQIIAEADWILNGVFVDGTNLLAYIALSRDKSQPPTLSLYSLTQQRLANQVTLPIAEEGLWLLPVGQNLLIGYGDDMERWLLVGLESGKASIVRQLDNYHLFEAGSKYIWFGTPPGFAVHDLRVATLDVVSGTVQEAYAAPKGIRTSGARLGGPNNCSRTGEVCLIVQERYGDEHPETMAAWVVFGDGRPQRIVWESQESEDTHLGGAYLSFDGRWVIVSTNTREGEKWRKQLLLVFVETGQTTEIGEGFGLTWLTP